MTKVMAANGTVTRWHSVLFGILLLTLAVLALPRPTVAQLTDRDDREFSRCIDYAFLAYNTCLMNAGTAFGRSVCDISFQFEAARCTAYQVGEIRKLWRGD